MIYNLLVFLFFRRSSEICPSDGNIRETNEQCCRYLHRVWLKERIRIS